MRSGYKALGLSHIGGRSIIALIVLWCIHVNTRGVTENCKKSCLLPKGFATELVIVQLVVFCLQVRALGNVDQSLGIS